MRRRLRFRQGSGTSRCRPTGFTLTEVVVASALLILAIVPILKALTSGHAMTARIEHQTRSLIFAQAKLDEIRARSIYDYSTLYSQASASLGDSYLCTMTDTSSGPDLRMIEVFVGFDRNDDTLLGSDEIEVKLVTLIARRW